ncbi:glycosyltransferase [Geminicoccaceae bacterium 1502E]|nr:glycosyltransferase [Geminicoccaceae bacterium 1502E]
MTGVAALAGAEPGAVRRRALLLAPQPFYAERGTPIAVRYVLEALSALGWEADLLTFPMGSEVVIDQVRIHRVGNPLRLATVPVGFSLGKLALDALLARDLRRLLQSRHYDVIHAVEEAALIATFVNGRGGPPLIYDMASSLPESLAEKPLFSRWPVQAVARAMERRMLSRASFVICSAGLIGRVRRMAPGVPAREWRFPAPPGARTDDATPALREELGLDPAWRIALYGGNFASYQGVEMLAEAAHRLMRRRQDLALVLLGAADEEEARAWRDRLGPELAPRVRVLRRQPRERVASFTALADILVSPRCSGTNFPLKLFDYLATGKPILATDIEAHRTVLTEELALLVPPSPAGLARGLELLLDEPARGARLAAAGRAFATRHLSWPRFVALVSEVYEAALVSGARRQAAGSAA